MSVLGAGTRKKPLDILQRPIPRTGKYSAVESVVDSGSTIFKVADEDSLYARKKENELFKRIRPTKLATVLARNLDDSSEQPSSQPQPLAKVDRSISTPTKQGELAGTSREILQWKPENNNSNNNSNNNNNTQVRLPYLLLDVRDKEEFEVNRIQTAINFPASRLSRSCNQYIPEIYMYRNKPNSWIFVYDDDERVANQAAQVMVEQGIDNVVVLTGGLRLFAHKHPVFVEGTLPAQPIPINAPSTPTRTKKPSSPSASSSASSIYAPPRKIKN